MPTDLTKLIVRHLKQSDYQSIWQKMRDFTDNRDASTCDEVWLLEHNPVYTQGQAGKPEHLLDAGDIPVVHTDRGGQITYHGPGQLIAYLLIDIKRRKFAVRQFVTAIEQSIIDLLAAHQIQAKARRDAPGVYVDGAKICSLGLRIRKGCSYHGLALNVDMDLEPFERINPCGLKQLKMTQLSALVDQQSLQATGAELMIHLCCNLGYDIG